MAKDETFETFPLGDWDLQSGEKIYDAHIAFKTFGDSKLPPIVYPTWFSGSNSFFPVQRECKVKCSADTKP
jgi:homoserine acetyltransferase